ncbi:GIY-YIG nuclease family protein [Dyella sp.]|uniref:GIY-YIG nuclease family protein n=1 Tax=Dyella sp. TaxID=1869338 RepID=UPI003F7DF140
MLIKSYGLFWRASEIDWNPGKGSKGAFRLLGRRGANSPGLQVCDFRYQQGIYILYGNFGPYYVGLTRKQGLGKRLKDHLSDQHEGLWDRFSWFGFRAVLKGKDHCGMCKLRAMAEVSFGKSGKAIGDIEALLIKSMGLSNVADMKFADAKEWVQVENHETKYYLNKICR